MRQTIESDINKANFGFYTKNLTTEQYMIEIDNLRQYLFEKEKETAHFKTLVVKKNDEINRLNTTIKTKNDEIHKHTNSIRYRIGSCCVNATKSFSGFLLFPFNMLKLLIHREEIICGKFFFTNRK